jgi:hypothetical protein
MADLEKKVTSKKKVAAKKASSKKTAAKKKTSRKKVSKKTTTKKQVAKKKVVKKKANKKKAVAKAAPVVAASAPVAAATPPERNEEAISKLQAMGVMPKEEAAGETTGTDSSRKSFLGWVFQASHIPTILVIGFIVLAIVFYVAAVNAPRTTTVAPEIASSGKTDGVTSKGVSVASSSGGDMVVSSTSTPGAATGTEAGIEYRPVETAPQTTVAKSQPAPESAKVAVVETASAAGKAEKPDTSSAGISTSRTADHIAATEKSSGTINNNMMSRFGYSNNARSGFKPNYRSRGNMANGSVNRGYAAPIPVNPTRMPPNLRPLPYDQWMLVRRTFAPEYAPRLRPTYQRPAPYAR